MRINTATFASGVLFGAGLALSDMINPGRVLAFLDLAGAWDPSLAFVMIGAILPSALAYYVSKRMGKPMLAGRFFVPESRIIDWRLVTGSTIFGVGWGIAGFCPGPAVASLVLGAWQAWVFVAAMFAGMVLHRFTTD